ncbi:MAG TPA: hypothetical protein VKZ50_11955 [bacterium]|nr:hypothetical protein [bacterium]
MSAIVRGGIIWALAATVVATGCVGPLRLTRGPAPTPRHATEPVQTSGGFTTSNAFVTVVRGKTVRLSPDAAAPVLDAVWQVLGAVPAIAPEPGGPRLLANLRMNEHLVDVTIWRTQALDVAGQRLGGVSGVVIPFTGLWRHRVLIVREGQVDASPPLTDSAELATIEHAVDAAGNHS